MPKTATEESFMQCSLLKPLQMPLQLPWPHCFPDIPEAKLVFDTNYREYHEEG